MRYLGYSLLGAFLVFGASCGRDTGEKTSNFGDIYKNDAQTRHKAKANESVWTVQSSGCTASMLTPEYILTASHCSPRRNERYRSGVAVKNGSSADLIATDVVERSGTYDYAIVKVRWINGKPKKGQKYAPFIATKASDIKLGKDGKATKIFTVGFPADKYPNVMYAEGYPKKYSSNRYLIYNIGIINGNSGGAVWRADNKMLVSMTNFGPHAYGQRGWNNNEPEDPKAWNGGGAMYKIYAQSTLLKKIFPKGDNKYVDNNGDPE